MLLLALQTLAAAPAAAWQASIVRDDWGIAHVHGHTDADAVFGMMYAQAEDDFNRIETNYLVSLGRLAEAEGEGALMQDLRQRLFIDPQDLQAQYRRSPAWLRNLMQAWAAGLNRFLATHPQVQPRVLRHFEPWMALSFSEGSIGGDIEDVDLAALQAFYGQAQPPAPHSPEPTVPRAPKPAAPGKAHEPVPARTLVVALHPSEDYREPGGSNGFAIAPSRTAGGYPLLLINPHTSFFFRSEQQVSSDAGLDVYGAATWGQFFIYQGFNSRAGWMHTSTGADNVDEFAEDVVTGPGGTLSYRYGGKLRPVARREIVLRYRAGDGTLAQRHFTTWATHHGPVVRSAAGRWITVALMNRPVAALQQSFLRTRARDLVGYLRVAQLRANSSNNTVFADARGDIAYLHPQFVPRRDDRFDYRAPVDGSDPATDWHGLHDLASLPQAIDPPNGWVMNTNNAPWTAAGADSPRQRDFPRYMDQVGENPRGLHAQRVLTATARFTPQSLMAAAYDSYLPAFAPLLPQLLSAWDHLPAGDPRIGRLRGPVALLRAWDLHWALDSTATSLAVFWGERLWQLAAAPARAARMTVWDYMGQHLDAQQHLTALGDAVDRLVADFGSWSVPWGEINRFQRNDGAIVQTFDDAKPSTPVPFTSSRWGSLASFGARRYPGTRRYYGTDGNSFVAVVEFGPQVRAWAVKVGGQSGDPASAHFTDQVQRYTEGRLRRIYYYPGELAGHIERRYHIEAGEDAP
ncbi:MAG: penicillin acylase family protein [Proteobacteria bacterium]|nr:penicillin acylase family protein [Pseudomonadota bacterium]